MTQKRKRAAQKTRERLISAVKELIEEKETDRITIEEITNRAEVAKGTFYVHFKRKEDLISEVLYEDFNKFAGIISDSGENVYIQIRSFLTLSVKLIIDQTLPIAQNWMKYSVAPLPGEELGVKKFRFDLDTISGYLTGAVERGELLEKTPVNLLAEEIVSQYYGIITLWCLTDGELSPEVQMENYCENSLKIILEKYWRR